MHGDDGVVRVLWQQLDQVGVAAQALDGHFVADARHDDLAVAHFLSGLHGEQVTVHDASVAHRHAAHLQQIVRLALEKTAFDGVALIDMFLRENGRTGCHAANQRQNKLVRTGDGQVELRAARRVDIAHGVGAQANAARRTADQLDHAFACQGLQVFFCRIGGFETQLGCNFGARWRSAGASDGVLDQVQNLLLTGGELGAVGHGAIQYSQLIEMEYCVKNQCLYF